MAEGLEALPSGSAVAWRTYADHLVVVHVDSEKRLRPTIDEIEAKEGFIPRQVTLTVKSNVWSRPGTRSRTPTTMKWTSGGWAFSGSKEQPLRLDGVPWLLTGHDYLVPITYTALTPNSVDKATWIPLEVRTPCRSTTG